MSAFESSMINSKVQKELYTKMVAVNRQSLGYGIQSRPMNSFGETAVNLQVGQAFLPRDIVDNDNNPFEQQIVRSVFCKVSADVVDPKTNDIMNLASYITGGPGGNKEATQANRPISYKDDILPNSHTYRGDTGITSVSVTQKSYFLNEILVNWTCPDPQDFETRIQPIFLKHGRLIVVEFGFGVNNSEFTQLSTLGKKSMPEFIQDIATKNQEYPSKYQVFSGQVTKYTFEATDYGGYTGTITIVSRGQNVLNSPVPQTKETKDLNDTGISGPEVVAKFKEINEDFEERQKDIIGPKLLTPKEKTVRRLKNAETTFKATINRLEDVVEEYLSKTEPESIEIKKSDKPLRYRYKNGAFHYWVGFNIDFKPEEIDILTKNQQAALEGYPELREKFKKETKWWKKALIGFEIGIKGTASVTTDFLIGNGNESTLSNLVKKGAAKAGETLFEAHLNDRERKSQHLVSWGWFEDHILNSFFQVQAKTSNGTTTLQQIRSVHKPYKYELDEKSTEPITSEEQAEGIKKRDSHYNDIISEYKVNNKDAFVNNRCNNSKGVSSLGLGSIMIPKQNDELYGNKDFTAESVNGGLFGRGAKGQDDFGTSVIAGSTALAAGVGTLNPVGAAAAGTYIATKEIGERVNVIEEDRISKLFKAIDESFPSFAENEDPNKNYGYIRNMVFDVKFLKESFTDITSVKDGLRDFWAKVNQEYQGFFNFQITQDIANDGRIGITDSNYLSPFERAEDLLDAAKQSRLDDFADGDKLRDKMFYLPIYSDYSIVRDFGLSLQLTDKAATLAALGTNSSNEVGASYHYDEGIEAFSSITALASGDDTNSEKIQKSFNPTLKQIKKQQQLKSLVVTGLTTPFSENKKGTTSDLDLENQDEQISLVLDTSADSNGVEFQNIKQVSKTIDEINEKIKKKKDEGVNPDEPKSTKPESSFKYDDFGIMKPFYVKQMLTKITKGEKANSEEKANYNLNKPIIPIELTFTIDGQGGLRVGNLFRVDYLPELYRKYTYFFISQVNHAIGAGGWTTSVTAKMKLDRPRMIKDGLLSKKVDETPKVKTRDEVEAEALKAGRDSYEYEGILYKVKKSESK